MKFSFLWSTVCGMNTMPQANYQQQQSSSSVPLSGEEKAKKEPPKIIEKVIESVEEFLTKPAKSQSKPQQKTERQLSPNQDTSGEQAASQADAGPSLSEVELPKGTTITLPDGKAFETQTESKISKT